MAAAETADLFVRLNLVNNLTPGLAKAQANLSKFGGTVSTAATRMTGAFGKLKSSLGGIITGPLGLIGLGGALFGLERALSSSVSKASAFGEAVAKLRAITGLTTQATSALVDTLDFYNISADTQVRLSGLAEKNLAQLTKTTKSAADFAKTYGLSLTTAGGKVKDFNTLLLDSADFFNNKAIPAQTKAAALAKIYGRNWQQLIPILITGSAAIKSAEADAIKLTDTDIANMAKFKDATREWNDAIGDLQITVGNALLPALTDLAKQASAFVRGHSADIVKFFKDAANFAQQVGKAVNETVVPAFQAIASAWDKVPDDLKKLLIGGFIANKLTGGAVTGLIGGLAKGAAGGLGSLLGGLRGATPANPVFVSSVGGLPGVGGLGGLGGAAGGLGISSGVAGIGAIVSVALPLVLVALAGAAARGALGVGGTNINLRGNAFGQNLSGTQGHVPSSYFSKLPANQADAIARSEQMFGKLADDVVIVDNATKHAGKSLDDLTLVTGKQVKTLRDVILAHMAEMRERLALFRREKLALHGGNQERALFGTNKKTALLVADALAIKFAKSNAPFYRDSKNSARTLADLKRLQQHFLDVGDRASAKKVGADIALMRTKQQATTNAVNAAATKIAAAVNFPGKNIDDTTLPKGGKKPPPGKGGGKGSGRPPGAAGIDVAVTVSTSTRDNQKAAAQAAWYGPQVSQVRAIGT